jgi:hypothetical protein
MTTPSMAMPRVRGGRWTAERRFYEIMAVACLAAVVLGFARSFLLRPWFPDHPVPPEAFFLFHGSAFFAWFVILAIQPTLIAAGRTDLHRVLGGIGAGLVAVMVVLGVTGALMAAGRPTGFVGVDLPPLQFLAIPLFDMIVFPALVAVAIARRRDRQSHKRLMLLASISILSAAVARWPPLTTAGPLAFFGVTDLFIVPLVIWDVTTRGRLHPATLWGGLLIVVSQPLRVVVSGTDFWLTCAAWAVGLVR